MVVVFTIGFIALFILTVAWLRGAKISRLGVPVGSLGPTRARCMERMRGHFEQLHGDPHGINEP